ncbi:hypothetical protein G6M89_06205 [Natronolimnobius sp. AArcel1]|uniref:hypothetical protein n=1 Tax=Natronolimnobius sp. AArcel1 TaxID=1679093 RepID=UPI0013ECC8A4|nr:hypothetical protein [Natronolimnobius sp. AArcel1]NGM68604.1 hypothetical protein [Natronolimnobius sp. AArcel1]
METPPELEAVAGDNDDIRITDREYDDEHVIAVDFGPAVGEPSLDIADGMAIVVVERAGDQAEPPPTASTADVSEQFEFAIPADATAVVVNNSVLTITAAK